MSEATDRQIQTFVDQRVRPHCEMARALKLAFDGDRAAIDDVYAALTGKSSAWVDCRTDGPPHLVTASDVLGVNAFMEDVRVFIEKHDQWPVVQKMCVRAVQG